MKTAKFIRKIERKMGWELTEDQKEVLWSTKHYARRWVRQTGKTTVLILKTILTFLQDSDKVILYVCPLQAIKRDVRNALVDICRKTKMPFPQSIHIKTRDQLCGYSADLILIEEASLFDPPLDHYIETQLRDVDTSQIISLYTIPPHPSFIPTLTTLLSPSPEEK